MYGTMLYTLSFFQFLQLHYKASYIMPILQMGKFHLRVSESPSEITSQEVDCHVSFLLLSPRTTHSGESCLSHCLPASPWSSHLVSVLQSPELGLLLNGLLVCKSFFSGLYH